MNNTKPISNSLVVTLIFIAALFASLTTQSVLANPSAAELGNVINLAGKQRMLTQKMSKEIMLVTLGVNKAENLGNLKKTAELFDKTLTGLRDGDAGLGLPATTEKRVLRQLKKVAEDWAQFYPVVKNVLANQGANKAEVEAMASLNIPLLKKMNKAVGQYEKLASKAGISAEAGLATSINLAGKQRMLTQKMSKEVLLIAYGHNVETNKLNLLETINLFDRTLKGLVAGDSTLGLAGTSDADITGQIAVVSDLWGQFKPAINKATLPETTSVSDAEIETVARLNLPLLKEMNKAVGLFAAQAK